MPLTICFVDGIIFAKKGTVRITSILKKDIDKTNYKE